MSRTRGIALVFSGWVGPAWDGGTGSQVVQGGMVCIFGYVCMYVCEAVGKASNDDLIHTVVRAMRAG